MKPPAMPDWAAGAKRLLPARRPSLPSPSWNTLRRPPAALVVVALLVGGTVAADQTHTPLRPVLGNSLKRIAPVVGSIAVCPDALSTKGVTTRISAGTGSAGSARIGAIALAAGASEKIVADEGARVGEFALSGEDSVAVVATATGEQAGGMAAEQVTRAETGQQHGLSSVRCEPAIADSWYVGAATTISDRSELLLVNPYDDAATVDVELYTRKGRVDPPGTTGISVKARSRVVKAIADWVQDEAWLAVHVVVRSGRVSPAVRRMRTVRQQPSGVDWLPRSAAPQEEIGVGALPGGEGERTLLLVNPGLDVLTVRVQVTLQDGQFRPIDLADIEVPGQQLVSVPLTAELDGKSAMLTVITDGPPALAAAYAEYTDPAVPGVDFVYAAGMAPLSGSALLTDNRVGEKVDTALMFSAPEGPAEITLTEVLAPDAVGPARTQLVPVKQGALVVVALSRAFGRGDPLPIVVTVSANSAPVYGTRVIVEKSARGPLVTALGIQGQLGGVPLPEVEHDPRGWLMTPRG